MLIPSLPYAPLLLPQNARVTDLPNILSDEDAELAAVDVTAVAPLWSPPSSIQAAPRSAAAAPSSASQVTDD